MQLEIKVVLEALQDYETVVAVLQPNFITEESYRDYFFDFASGELSALGSILRLRVPGLPARAHTPLHLQGTGAAPGVVPEYSPHLAYEEFMNSCRAPTDGADSYAQPLGSSQGGRLTFKQRNTVERGEQLNFVVEDKAVPPAVVAKLLAGDKVSDVLVEHAQATANADSGARQIVERLRQSALRVAELRTILNGDSASEGYTGGTARDEDRAFYTQMRYSAGADVMPPSQERIASVFAGLSPTGSYTTVRKVFMYPQTSVLGDGGVEPQEQQRREQLRVQVDRTEYPFMEKFELEVPRIPGAQSSEVLEEVKGLLGTLGVRYQLGSESKYECFIRGLQGVNSAPADVCDVKLRLSSQEGYLEVCRNLEDALQSTNLPDRDRRSIANTHLDTSRQGADELSWGNGELSSSEGFHDNYFLDTQDGRLRESRAFLRVRRFNNGARFDLVLKEGQSVADGTQENQTTKMELSADSAHALLTNPTTFLVTQYAHNAIMHRLWVLYDIRELVPAAFFTTHRMTMPWIFSQTQKFVINGNMHAHSIASAAVSTQLGLATPAYLLATQRQQLSASPPLLIHLDRTMYPLSELTSLSRAHWPNVRIDEKTGKRTYEIYELEVTNLASSTSPAAVMQELTETLRGMGVEWQRGTQSKLNQYYALGCAEVNP